MLLVRQNKIAGWLRHAYPNDESSRVSHETIYKSLFIQTRGALKKELLQHLRSQRAYAAQGMLTRKGMGRDGSRMQSPSVSDLPL